VTKRRAARREAVEESSPPPLAVPTPRQRRLLIGISLAALLGLQLVVCADKLRLPFLDTRLHYNFDNARFTFMARNGNENGDLRSQLGVTWNTNVRWGHRGPPPAYYTDHPFLMKAIFQQYTKLVGTAEWASRSFYLALAFLTVAGVFLVFLRTTGSFAASLGGAAALATLPVFALYQTCVKFETDGMVISVWLFLALLAYLQNGTRRSFALYAAAVWLAFLTHWTAILFAGAIGIFLLVAWRRAANPRAGKALLATLAAGAGGLVVLLALMSWLQRGWSGALAALAGAFHTRAAPVPADAWWARQSLYFTQNFGRFGWLLVVVGVLLAVAGGIARRRLTTTTRRSSRGAPRPRTPTPAAPPRSLGLLYVFFFATLSVACMWLFGFRQGSFVHSYWQLWFCLPVATLVAIALASFGTSPRGVTAGAVAAIGLVLVLVWETRVSYRTMLHEQLGSAEDISFLVSLRDDPFDRMVFVPVTESPFNQWFQGPLFEYYTDRPVAIAAQGTDVNPGNKLLVLRSESRADVVAGVERWSQRKLANEKCGLRICAYDVATVALPEAPAAPRP